MSTTPTVVLVHGAVAAFIAQPDVAAGLICPRAESQRSQLEDGPCR
jgi:hypothetical protein